MKVKTSVLWLSPSHSKFCNSAFWVSCDTGSTIADFCWYYNMEFPTPCSTWVLTVNHFCAQMQKCVPRHPQCTSAGSELWGASPVVLVLSSAISTNVWHIPSLKCFCERPLCVTSAPDFNFLKSVFNPWRQKSIFFLYIRVVFFKWINQTLPTKKKKKLTPCPDKNNNEKRHKENY
jgi:hypothetical protein